MGRGFSGPRSTSVESHSGSNMETRLRSLLNVPRSLRSGGVAPGPATTEENYQEDLDASKDSESSWVAEDNGSVEDNMDQQTNESKGQRLGRLRTNHLPPLDLREVDEREEEYTYDLGEGRAEVVQPISHLTPVTKTAEQVILQVENPSTKSPPSPKTSSTDASRSTLSSSILNRLYTTNPFAMSTPQLSPVHEAREEEGQQHNGAAKSLVSGSGVSRSQFHSQSSMLTVAAADRSLPLPSISTPSKLQTEESLRRSPFRSPFYSGRTSFGGIASGQKPRFKRPRTESSPPVFAPLRLSVMARPVSSGSKGGPLVASQTAKKIMESLGSLSSPLANARKLPMRALPGETQVAKRRRVSLDSEAAATSGSSFLSPPPIAPLRTPSQPSHSGTKTQIVPNEKSISTPSLRDGSKEEESSAALNTAAGDTWNTINKMPRPTGRSKDKVRGDDSNAGPTVASSLLLSSSSSSTPSSSSGGSKLTFTVPNFSSTMPPIQSSILSGLTFTAPPFAVKPADSPDEQLRNRSPPATADDDTRNLCRGGGKMRTVRRSRRTEEEETFEEDTGYSNPMAPPPSVGLSLGKGGTLPKFLFHTQLAPVVSKDAASSSSIAPQSTNLSSSPAFSFSAPKSISSTSEPTKMSEKPPQLDPLFNFSAPKDHGLTPTPPPPNSSLTQGSFKPSPSLTTSSLTPASFPPLPKMSLFTSPSSNLNFAKPKEQPKDALPPPPPLKNMSVEEALKMPEFQLPVSQTAVSPASVTKTACQEAEICIDLTDSDDEKESGKTSKSSTSSAGEATKAGGGLQLGSSGGGLKLGTSGGLKLGAPHGTQGIAGMAGKLGAAGGSGGPSASLLKTDSKSSAAPFKSLAQFAPPSGSWSCPQCLVSNQAKDDVCVACSASKPPSKTESKSSKASLGSLSQFAPPSGSWECGQCLVRNQAKDDKCLACSAPKPSTLSSKTDSKLGSGAPVFKPLAQFAPPSGSWECGQCLVNNKATDKTCVACSTARPVQATTTASSSLSQPVGLEHKEAMKGLALGAQLAVSGWSCEACLVQNKATDAKCIACTASKPGAMVTADAPPTSGSWTGSMCLVENKAVDTKPGPKLSAPPSNTLSGFAPPTGSWTCDTCLVQNKAEDSTCLACSSPKPGGKPSVSGGSKPTTSSGLAVPSSAGGIKLGGGLSLAGFKPLGSQGNGQQGVSAPIGGGVKIGVSLPTALGGPPKNDKTTSEQPKTSSGSSGPAPVQFGLPQASGGVSTIAQLPEKNPLAGIKFGISTPASSSSAATSQNTLGGIKFGVPSTTTTTVTVPSSTTASLQFGLGSTSSTASSPFKLGSLASSTSDKQPVGLKLGGAASPAAPKLTVGLGQVTTLQSSSVGSGGLFGSGVQPSTGAATAVNPLAGIKFGVAPSSQPSLSAANVLPSKQLQFGVTTTTSAGSSSSSGLAFNFSATSSTATVSGGLGGSSVSPFVFSGAKSNSNGQSALQLGASAVPSGMSSLQQTKQQPSVLNSMLNASSTSEKPSSSLFVFSGNKEATKISSSSPFTTGGASGLGGGASGLGGGASGLGGGASGLGGGASGLGSGASGLGSAASSFKLNFGGAQPPSNQPFQFGMSSVTSSSLFGKPEAAASQPGGLTLPGQQPASGLTLPQSQGSIFGGPSQQSQSQPQAPSFNFSGQAPSLTGGSLGGGLGLGASTNLTFPPPSSGGLTFGPSSSQGVGLGGAATQASTTSGTNSQGFQFNPNAGISLNFGGGQPGGGGMFTAGGSSQTGSAPSSRVIKKARRRNK